MVTLNTCEDYLVPMKEHNGQKLNKMRNTHMAIMFK